jgi:hypothetical protein
MRTDRRTDITKLIVAYNFYSSLPRARMKRVVKSYRIDNSRNFANAPKNLTDLVLGIQTALSR